METGSRQTEPANLQRQSRWNRRQEVPAIGN